MINIKHFRNEILEENVSPPHTIISVKHLELENLHDVPGPLLNTLHIACYFSLNSVIWVLFFKQLY